MNRREGAQFNSINGQNEKCFEVFKRQNVGRFLKVIVFPGTEILTAKLWQTNKAEGEEKFGFFDLISPL